MKSIKDEIKYLEDINKDTPITTKYIDFLKSLKKNGDEYVTSKDVELTKQFEDDYNLNIHHEGKVIFQDKYMLGDFIAYMNSVPAIFYASEIMFEDEEY